MIYYIYASNNFQIKLGFVYGDILGVLAEFVITVAQKSWYNQLMTS